MSAEIQPKPVNVQRRRLAYIIALFVVWVGLTIVQWRIFEPGAPGTALEALAAFALANFNILLLLLLLFLTFRNLAKLTLERKKGVLGSKLKTRLVMAFLATTVIPTVAIFLVSAGFLVRSIDGWFSTKVENALENSMEVARSYYAAERQTTFHSGRMMAERLIVAKNQGLEPGETVTGLLESLRRRQRIEQAFIVYASGEIVKSLSPGLAEAPGLEKGADQIKAAFEGREGDAFIPGTQMDIVRAMVPLAASVREKPYAVLVVDRVVPVSSVGKLEQITRGIEEYRQVQLNLYAIKASYIFPLLLMSLLIMFAATWMGFRLARTITEPIGALVDATQRVAGGDLDFQLTVEGRDEVSTLVGYFNDMTRDLRASREKAEAAGLSLSRTNAELESWRKYMETVMARISAGVVGTDPSGRITTLNHAAQEMLGLGEEVIGEHYRKVFPPEVAEALDETAHAKGRQDEPTKQQVVLPGDGMSRTVMLHHGALKDTDGELWGTVTVLNDLTDLVKAERAHAWREVARRVAHEIKNPLTPIQLSAQRLRRRYGALLETPEGEILDEATRTIISQVDGLKQMVNEFSRFAKMPESRQLPAELSAVVDEAVSLYRPAHANIAFNVSLAGGLPLISIDPEQIKRAIVNLLENSVNALAETENPAIEVTTALDEERQAVRVEVADNGRGLSPQARDHLFEPYFSTRKGGTGLGLAIVKSIVADHRGYVRAMDNKPNGTRLVIELPLSGVD